MRIAGGVLFIASVSFAVLAPARADVELTPGSAAAQATVGELNIPYGGANVGVAVGTTNASFFEGTGKSSAIVLEPAFLRIPSVLKLCGGELVVTVPPPTVADSATPGGPVSNTKEVGPDLGVERAAAEPGSHGGSSVTTSAFGLPGVVELRGGEADTDARLDVGSQTRAARAEVRTGSVSLVDGLIELRGLRWTIDQAAVGADSRSIEATQDARFSVGSVTLAGLPLPSSTAEELRSTVASLNSVLDPIGLELRLPEVRAFGANGVQITPLTVAIGGDPVYGPALYPLLAGPENTSLINLFNSATQPLIFEPATCNSLFGLLKASPELNTFVNTLGTYTPVILSAAAAAINGGAELNFNIGGVRTTYDATYYAPRAVAPPSVTRPSTAGAPATGSSTPGVAPVPPSELASSPTKISTSCATTSPVGKPGCWKGTGPVAATLAAVLTAGLFATDELVRRRRRGNRIEDHA